MYIDKPEFHYFILQLMYVYRPTRIRTNQNRVSLIKNFELKPNLIISTSHNSMYIDKPESGQPHKNFELKPNLIISTSHIDIQPNHFNISY